MSQQKKIYQQALKLIDAANAEDPNIVKADGRDWPKELLYSERMTEMLDRYSPLAADAMKLAIRAQHIERWKSPRNAYPMDRLGYLKWRKDLYKIQADVAAKLLDRAGFDEVDIERVRKAVAKKSIKSNPDTQLLEDVTDLCFIEHYLVDFVARHPDYSEEKWIDIIRKTWNKMSDNAHQFALSGKLKLPESLSPLIVEAVSGE